MSEIAQLTFNKYEVAMRVMDEANRSAQPQ